MNQPSIDIVVPTYREAANIRPLLERLAEVRRAHSLPLFVTLVDDNSQDGIEAVVAEFGCDWARVLVRPRDRGLSSAVLHGIKHSGHDVIIVMDADLSHPPERIPAMLTALSLGADFVVGSRYAHGGTTDDDWGFFRWLNSRVATLLARPFTNIQDPMSGFFALRRTTYQQARDLNPIGYKIGLELLVKCGCQNVLEVPIHFENRTRGESKLSLKEQLRYVQHIRRLYLHSYATFSEVGQFLVVGLTGAVVNLGLLTAGLTLGLERRTAVAGAILISMTSNFLLNRRFTFSYAKDGPLIPQYLQYVLSVSFGALANYVVTMGLLYRSPDLTPQTAAGAGIAVGTVLNFIAMKYLVFRRRHIRLRT